LGHLAAGWSISAWRVLLGAHYLARLPTGTTGVASSAPICARVATRLRTQTQHSDFAWAGWRPRVVGGERPLAFRRTQFCFHGRTKLILAGSTEPQAREAGTLSSCGAGDPTGIEAVPGTG